MSRPNDVYPAQQHLNHNRLLSWETTKTPILLATGGVFPTILRNRELIIMIPRVTIAALTNSQTSLAVFFDSCCQWHSNSWKSARQISYANVCFAGIEERLGV